MIVPSIDLMGGQAVQLVGGREMELEAGDPRPLADTFGRVYEIAVIDLDAALSQGDNGTLVEELCQRARCRVGGGIRDVETARRWLDHGAERIILGTAARPEILRELPRDRTIAALDAVNDEVVVEGWRTKTGATVIDRMKELRDLVGGFLVTFVEREGRLVGMQEERVRALVEAAGDARVTVAGGVKSADEIGWLDAMGVDAQVGMALYKGHLDLAQSLSSCLRSDRPDGLWPTVVTDVHGHALGLVYSSEESLRRSIETGRGHYHSRKRGPWEKGATSGATQDVLRIDLDCDRDALKFTVRQAGRGFCHRETWTCWGEDHGLPHLARLLRDRVTNAPEGSYTKKLIDDPTLLAAKLREEVGELVDAGTREDVAWEAADVVYFTLVRLAAEGVPLEALERELARRARKVTRRPGGAKS